MRSSNMSRVINYNKLQPLDPALKVALREQKQDMVALNVTMKGYWKGETNYSNTTYILEF